MRLSSVSRILKETFNADVPDWVDQLLTPLNAALEQLISALNNRLTFQDNFQCKVVTQTFTSGIAKLVSVPKNTRVFGILPVEVSNRNFEGYGFTRNTDGSVSITLNFDGVGDRSCTVILLLG